MPLTADDRLDIVALTNRFDNAVDAEELDAYGATFAPDGQLEGFWGVHSGPRGIEPFSVGAGSAG